MCFNGNNENSSNHFLANHKQKLVPLTRLAVDWEKPWTPIWKSGLCLGLGLNLVGGWWWW